MSKAVAFFPWVWMNVPVEIGPIRFIPYKKGVLPGDLPQATQSDLDAILEAYALQPGKLVTRAVLVEYGTWYTGGDVESCLTRLFEARDFIAFAALAKRRLFRRHFSYCNSDTYAIVVQRYLSCQADRFSFSTRRRDGTTSRMWGSDDFAFQCPLHVDPVALDIDTELLGCLLTSNIPDHVREAIVEFNNANTDAREVREHAEIVMTKSAFEWLYQIDEKAQSLEKALCAALSPIVLRTPYPAGPLVKAWQGRWRRHSLIEAWVRDFCAVRGVAAHGRERGKTRTVWSGASHRAFAAVVFPLLVKLQLRALNLLELSGVDHERLSSFEGYISHDPLSATSCVPDGEHPWDDLEDMARVRGTSWRAQLA